MNKRDIVRCASILTVTCCIAGAATAQEVWVCAGSLPGLDGTEDSDTGRLTIAPDKVISEWGAGSVEQSICEAGLCVGHGENFYWIEEVVRAKSGKPLHLGITAFGVLRGIPEHPPNSYVVELSDCSRTSP